MSSLKAGAEQVMRCSTASGGTCDRTAPGHVLRPLQERIAAATASKWRDGVVSSVSGGWIGVTFIDCGDTAWVWAHLVPADLAIGQPVALHSLYSTLAFGSVRLSVLVSAAI
ncbi:MAG TPA: hypothetical protein VGO88_00695 [Mycetocola sp.]|jgi:hypothetical protein|nr:hypothetical protein [Mycetocola sp.]HEV7847831.1 hypothetical protein [Mycetocola sp.]